MLMKRSVRMRPICEVEEAGSRRGVRAGRDEDFLER
jgi:hypothetical protein